MVARAPFVVVAGNIGVGKSVLADALGRAFGVPAHHEQPEQNPFFGAPDTFPFHAELYFLVSSAGTQRTIDAAGGGIQERSVREHVPVFAAARHDRGWLSTSELELLNLIHDRVVIDLAVPDVLVYLHADVTTLQQRIALRGRPEESALDTQYLLILSELYERFVRDWGDRSPLVRVDTAQLDVRDDQNVYSVKRMIQEAL